LQGELAERGVSIGVHYPIPVPFQAADAHLGHRPVDFPVAEDLMRHCWSVPMYAELTDEQIRHTTSAIEDLLLGFSQEMRVLESGAWQEDFVTSLR